MAAEFLAYLDQTDSYYRWNLDQWEPWHVWDTRPGIADKDLLPRDLERELEEDRYSYRHLVRCYANKMAEVAGVICDEKRLDAIVAPDWSTGQTLADILAAMQNR